MSVKESLVLMTNDYITTVFYIVSRYFVDFRGNGASSHLRLRSYWQSSTECQFVSYVKRYSLSLKSDECDNNFQLN